MKKRSYNETKGYSRTRTASVSSKTTATNSTTANDKEEMINMYSKMNDKEELTMEEKIKSYLIKSIDVFVVLLLSVLFNISSFSEFLKFKSVPFLYDIQTEQSTIPSIILKASLIAITFGIIKYFIK